MIDLSAPRASVAISAEDMLILAGRYGAAAIVAGDSGDQAACDRLFAEAGRFAKAATDLQKGVPVGQMSTGPLIMLDQRGVDQHGNEWQPRRWGAMLAVHLGVREIMQLRQCYAAACGEALARRDPDGWTICEQRRAELLLHAAVLDPNAMTFAHNEEPERSTGRC